MAFKNLYPDTFERGGDNCLNRIAEIKPGRELYLLRRRLIISHTFVMGLGPPFKGPHKFIHGRLAAAVRAADALFMGNGLPLSDVE